MHRPTPPYADPDPGLAFSVAVAPAGYVAEQVPGQDIPPPDTDPLPAQANETDKAFCGGGSP